MKKHWAWPALATLWSLGGFAVFAAVVVTFLWAGGGLLTTLRPPAVLPVS